MFTDGTNFTDVLPYFTRSSGLRTYFVSSLAALALTLACSEARADLQEASPGLPAELPPPPMVQSTASPLIPLPQTLSAISTPVPSLNTQEALNPEPSVGDAATKAPNALVVPTMQQRIGTGFLYAGVPSLLTPLLVEVGLHALVSKARSAVSGGHSSTGSDSGVYFLNTKPAYAMLGVGAAFTALGVTLLVVKSRRPKFVLTSPAEGRGEQR